MTQAFTRKRILVIDDDPALRRLIVFGLERAGYSTVSADNGAAGKDALCREPVDLIMVDLMMPVVDGLGFLRWLRQEARAELPAIVFTSYDAKGVAEEVIATGATDLIKKPVRLPELLEKVARLIGKGA